MNNEKKEDAALSSVERIAKYKDERRRQMQAKFISATSRLREDHQKSSSNGEASKCTNTSGDNSPNVKTTRTSRLRAAIRANDSAGDPKLTNNSPHEKLIGSSRAGTTPSENDKSNFRKSNLNRSSPSSSVQENAASDDNPKNRRRGRRFFPPEVLHSQNNTALQNEQKTTPTTRSKESPNGKFSYARNNKENLKRFSAKESEKTDMKCPQRTTHKRVEDLTTHNTRHSANESKLIPQIDSSGGPAAVSTPISILKRKEVASSHHHNTSPVTFSPSVVDTEVPKTRRIGILKKRRSLDESQVLWHRSCSSDAASSGTSKPQQRRSSLEEITSIAPDLPGILKRRSVKHEDDDASLNSPQSILKRKSGSSSAGSTNTQHSHQHVSITTAAILAAAKGAEMILDNPTAVRPILKKKKTFEDGDNECLKPILKKKSSTEMDDEEKPKRPILKTRSSSNPQQDSNYSAYEYDGDVRPILKFRDGSSSSSSSSASSRPRLSFCEARNNADSVEVDQLLPDSKLGVLELVRKFESKGAIRKTPTASKHRTGRFKTQPVTFNELEASLSFIQATGGCEQRSLSSQQFPCYGWTQVPSASMTDEIGPKMSFDSAFQSLGDGLEMENAEKPKKTDLQLQMKNIALEARSFKSSQGKTAQPVTAPQETINASANEKEDTNPTTAAEEEEEDASKTSKESDSAEQIEDEGISSNDDDEAELRLDTDANDLLAEKESELRDKEAKELQRSSSSAESQSRLKVLENDKESKISKSHSLVMDQLNSLNFKNLCSDGLSSKTSILQMRKDELDTSSRLWKSRVEKSDAENFTVAKRMALEKVQNIGEEKASPLSYDKKKPLARRFKSKLEVEEKEFKSGLSVPGTESQGVIIRKVQVLKTDDESFKSFFRSHEVKSSDCSRIQLDVADFDSVVRQPLLVQKKNVHLPKRRLPTKEQLYKRIESSLTEYTEIITEVDSGVTRETSPDEVQKRQNLNRMAKANPHLALEALAGLASNEDIKSITLKKPSLVNSGTHLPFQTIMLLHVKGRKNVQTRLVEPVTASMNQGDCFILITPRNLFSYVGCYANVIETSRATDIINRIVQAGDMGCKVEKATVVNVKKGNASKEEAKFWRHLGAANNDKVEIAKAGPDEEDKLFESNIIATNMIYSLENDELAPLEECWGKLPKFSLLSEEKVLVFDFGSEMYVWSGKNADHNEKKRALTLAKELWDQGFNYSECSTCPLNVSQILGSRSDIVELPKSSKSRPPWALFAKLTQNRETVLFKEKFCDWPEKESIIKSKPTKKVPSRTVSTDSNKSESNLENIKSYDMSALFNLQHPEPDFEVEGSHLGRGTTYYDKETNRHFEVKTYDVTVWSITESSYEKIPEDKKGHFYDNLSYIIRWQFSVTVTGRELSGKPSKHAALGRDRCVYFCWMGRKATANEKGAAALLAVELDSEKTKQIRIMQGAEPPVFLQMFDGRMVVHSANYKNQKTHLYIVKGDVPCEVSLIEAKPAISSLRSRTSFLAVQNGNVYVWHGSKAPQHTRMNALKLAEHITATKPTIFDLLNDVTIKEINEGQERELKLKTGSTDNKMLPYFSLKDNTETYEKTPKLFHFTSLMGKFEANEILCPHRSINYCTAYPFLQSDLYSASQPALFLFDNDHEIWLWQGWWPEKDNDPDNFEQTGSGPVRWQAERRAAMQTALQYWNLTHEDWSKEKVPAYLVWAGHEPLAFTNLFPYWNDNADIKQLKVGECKTATDGEFILLESELAMLTRDTYSIEELMQRPLPNGVDPSKLEIYLSSDSFEQVMCMTREEFQALPVWQQTKLKKDKGLF